LSLLEKQAVFFFHSTDSIPTISLVQLHAVRMAARFCQYYGKDMKEITNQRVRKILYYARAFSQQFLVPDVYFRNQLERKLKWIDQYDRDAVFDRVDYYNKLDHPFSVSDQAVPLRSIPFNRQTVYYYDLRPVLCHFPKDAVIDYIFGDVNWIPEQPSIVKSRPVSGDNANDIILNMESLRHFRPIRDSIPYEAKLDQLVWRGAGWQPHRKEFLRRFWNHPLCDAGMVNTPEAEDPADWVKPKMTVDEQLRYKFILSIEGNDVASNLKWISQSNSLCFMAKPKFETWFMEGRIVPFEHYVEVRDDYADLPEKIAYYLQHEAEAKAIIHNFQNYFRNFGDPRLEELVALLVVRKYLEKCGQYVL
jgi:hypothetical protein